MPKILVKDGGTMLFNIYDDDDFGKVESSIDIISNTISYLRNHTIDYSSLQVGDVVGMYYPLSTEFGSAAKGTTYNTHLGVVIGHDQNGKAIVEHKIGRKVYKDSIDNICGKAVVTVGVRPKLKDSQIKLDWAKDKANYKIDKKYQNENLTQYIKSLGGAKETLSKVFDDIDVDSLELMAIAILKRETNFMTNTQSKLREEGNIAANLRGLYHWAIGTPEESISSDLTKTKLASLNPEERTMLGIEKPSDLDNPKLAARSVLYILCRNAEYFKHISVQYPELRISDQDIIDAAVLSYNQGMTKSLRYFGFKEDGTYNKDYFDNFHKVVDIDAKNIKDYNSTNWKYVPFGEEIYNLTNDGYVPYVTYAKRSAKKYITKIK